MREIKCNDYWIFVPHGPHEWQAKGYAPNPWNEEETASCPGVILDPTPEPPNRTVVLDRDGDAWQRCGAEDDGFTWKMAGSDEGEKWQYLMRFHKPVRVVWTP